MRRRRAKSTHVLNFVVHTVVGTVLFLVVALPALVLNVLVYQLAAYGATRFTLAILTLIEHAILIFDGVAVLVYIGVSTWGELQEMLDE